jgi:hypothetical protein
MKIQLFLDKYIEDKNPTRLRTFLNLVNPGKDLKLSKQKAEELNLLINDYEVNNKEKYYYNLIMQYLGMPKNTRRLSKNIDIPKETKQFNIEEIKEQKIISEEDRIINELDYRVKTATEIEMKKEYRAALEQALINRASNIKYDVKGSEINILKSTFGDWFDEKSMSYKILNNQINYFKITTIYNPSELIKKLYQYNNAEQVIWSAGITGIHQGSGQTTWTVSKGNKTIFTQDGMHQNTNQELPNFGNEFHNSEFGKY